jgi:thiol-disulfide isomerase/thioredoxin
MEAIEKTHPGEFKAVYIPWDDSESPEHEEACSGLRIERPQDPKILSLIKQVVGAPVTAPQLLLLERKQNLLTLAGLDVWRQVFTYGARGYPWTEARLSQLADDFRKRAPRLQFLKTAERSTLQRGKQVAAVTVDQVADAADIVGLYFSASWCGPCRSFTPRLVAAYYKLRAAQERFEVILVSADRGQEQFNPYFEEMPWLALPFHERDIATDLDTLYEISGIPSLVLVNIKDGSVVTTDGVDVIRDGKPWPFKAVSADCLCCN